MIMRGNRLFLALASGLSAVVLAVAVAIPAQASDVAPTVGSTVTTTTAIAPLLYDCSTLTAAGRQYAVNHNVNICGVLGGTDKGTVASPDNTVYNNCGSASISMSDAGHGDAMIVWSVHSTQGWIIWYSTTVTYSGASRSGSVGFTGVPMNINAGDYTTPYTGEGWASAYLSGTVETVLADCYVAYPETSHFVG
jgi:hypothetical protein